MSTEELPTVSLGQVRQAHQRVTTKMGRDYVNPDGFFRDNRGRPLCVVGHIFDNLKLDLAAIPDGLNGQYLTEITGHLVQAALGVRMTYLVIRYLHDLQHKVDTGMTWGKALKEMK